MTGVFVDVKCYHMWHTYGSYGLFSSCVGFPHWISGHQNRSLLVKCHGRQTLSGGITWTAVCDPMDLAQIGLHKFTKALNVLDKNAPLTNRPKAKSRGLVEALERT